MTRLSTRGKVVSCPDRAKGDDLRAHAQLATPDAGPPRDTCPDPMRCEYRWRHASGPWSCEANHPQTAHESEAKR